MQIAQALRVMVFDASAADLAAAEREPVYEHGAPAVLRGGGVDLLARSQAAVRGSVSVSSSRSVHCAP